jgi:Tfp pilus assembly protein PilE
MNWTQTHPEYVALMLFVIVVALLAYLRIASWRYYLNSKQQSPPKGKVIQ